MADMFWLPANERKNSVEKKQTSRKSTELNPSLAGVVEVVELFYMRIGKLRFRQQWVDCEVSPSLTIFAVLGIAAGGFLLGYLASYLLREAEGRCLGSDAGF